MTATRVLILEDNANVRTTWVDALEALGYEVEAVDDGARALDAIPHFQPNVILLDLIMPRAEIDGFAFLSRLRATPSTATIPVLVISGLGDPLATAAAQEPVSTLGIAGILTKPVALDTLAREIDRAAHSGASF